MSLYEAQLADSRRDGTHDFHEGEDTEFCRQCGKRRWAHVHDGHRASPTGDSIDTSWGFKSEFSRHPPQAASRAEARAKMIEELKRQMVKTKGKSR